MSPVQYFRVVAYTFVSGNVSHQEWFVLVFVFIYGVLCSFSCSRFQSQFFFFYPCMCVFRGPLLHVLYTVST